MSANIKKVVVRERELATYLVFRRISGPVEIEFDIVEQTPYFVFNDKRANKYIAEFRANGLKEILTRYYSAVRELDLAVELAAVAKGIE